MVVRIIFIILDLNGKIYSIIYKQFTENNDLNEILEVIDIIFQGFPEKFVLEYLKQYYSYK